MSPGFSLFMTAGAEVLGLLVILREGHGVGREKFAHREIDVAEQAARIVGAAAGALFLRHTVIVHRHQELGIPLQTDDGELPQSNVDPAAFVSAALHEPGVQNDGVHRLHNRLG